MSRYQPRETVPVGTRTIGNERERRERGKRRAKRKQDSGPSTRWDETPQQRQERGS